MSDQIRFFPIFFVRSWFEWVVSFYHHVKSFKDHPDLIKRRRSLAEIIIMSGGLNEYMRFVSDGYIPTVCSNSRLPMFKDLQINGIPPIKNEWFMRHMRMCHIGVTERYDESLVVMEHGLAPHFPDIDLSYDSPIHMNPSKAKMATYVAERSATEPNTLKLLKKRLEDAIWLYDFANTELDRKISAIPNFTERLEHFRFRCRIKV